MLHRSYVSEAVGGEMTMHGWGGEDLSNPPDAVMTDPWLFTTVERQAL